MQAPKLPPGKYKLAAVPLIAIAAIVAGLSTFEGGRRLTPYWDALGERWTVCNGVTGPEVIPGKQYTDAECDGMETRFVNAMLKRMGGCVTAALEFHEIKAWGDFAYNVGTANFCGSTAAKLLNQGKNKEACAQIPRWHFVGTKDCSIAAKKCLGIPRRRAWEQSVCLGDSQ